jgi:putative intracellular protease/amidase
VTGPLEVLHAAGGYTVDVVTPGGAGVRSSSGLVLGGAAALDEAPLHTLLIAVVPGSARR